MKYLQKAHKYILDKMSDEVMEKMAILSIVMAISALVISVIKLSL